MRKSMKRKSMMRKSMKRKSMKRKSMMRKSMKRKSMMRKSMKRKSMKRKIKYSKSRGGSVVGPTLAIAKHPDELARVVAAKPLIIYNGCDTKHPYCKVSHDGERYCRKEDLEFTAGRFLGLGGPGANDIKTPHCLTDSAPEIREKNHHFLEGSKKSSGYLSEDQKCIEIEKLMSYLENEGNLYAIPVLVKSVGNPRMANEDLGEYPIMGVETDIHNEGGGAYGRLRVVYFPGHTEPFLVNKEYIDYNHICDNLPKASANHTQYQPWGMPGVHKWLTAYRHQKNDLMAIYFNFETHKVTDLVSMFDMTKLFVFKSNVYPMGELIPQQTSIDNNRTALLTWVDIWGYWQWTLDKLCEKISLSSSSAMSLYDAGIYDLSINWLDRLKTLNELSK
jgi:hypothetical protein